MGFWFFVQRTDSHRKPRRIGIPAAHDHPYALTGRRLILARAQAGQRCAAAGLGQHAQVVPQGALAAANLLVTYQKHAVDVADGGGEEQERADPPPVPADTRGRAGRRAWGVRRCRVARGGRPLSGSVR